MHIAVNARLLLKDKLEGIGWFSYETLRRITVNHPEVRFTFIFDRPFKEEFIFSGNVRPVVLRPQSRHPFLWYLFFQVSTKQYLSRLKPDLYLSPDGYLPLSPGIPTLAVIHDLGFEHFPNSVPALVSKYYRHYFPRFAREATRIATVSQFTAVDLQKTYGVPLGKIDVVYNGCNKHFSPISSLEKYEVRATYNNERPYFIYLGNLNRRKNIHRLISAFLKFAETDKSNFDLILVGARGYLPENIEKLLAAHPAGERVKFFGRINDNNLVGKLVGAARALLYPSLFEGFGIPCLEAMQCGTPVLTSQHSAMSEVCGKAAIYVDPHQTADITRGIRQLAEDDLLCAELSEEGLREKQNFSWDKTAELLFESCVKAIHQQMNA